MDSTLPLSWDLIISWWEAENTNIAIYFWHVMKFWFFPSHLLFISASKEASLLFDVLVFKHTRPPPPSPTPCHWHGSISRIFINVRWLIIYIVRASSNRFPVNCGAIMNHKLTLLRESTHAHSPRQCARADIYFLRLKKNNNRFLLEVFIHQPNILTLWHRCDFAAAPTAD